MPSSTTLRPDGCCRGCGMYVANGNQDRHWSCCPTSQEETGSAQKALQFLRPAYTLTVKGPPGNAQRTARERGLCIEDARWEGDARDATTTTLQVHGSHVAIADWFTCDVGECADGRGYPDGSLLYYREVTR